ncbi:MAG: FtsW/RodA/SpoVE family cell cycle protein [Candidatus Parcubacteria bacterium]|nr:FtsW/RodA/SpoVE family cell cycle protein [Candidatus Parcubacteria bacterium]
MKKFDYWFFGPIFLLLAIGFLTLISLSNADGYVLKQSIILILCAIVFLFFSFIDYRLFKNSSYLLLILYGLAIAALILLFIFGTIKGGTKGWFALGGFNFQPVELVKMLLILILAKYFSSRNIEIWQAKHIFISGAYMALPMLLVALQPDLASALVLVAIWLGVVFASGIKLKQVLVILMIFVFLAGIGWNFFLKDYQKQRLVSFINPTADIRGSGYNLRQSLVAIGSGGLLGKGLSWGTQTQLKFLPAAKTDFIFASIGEEMGFLGLGLVFACFAILFWRLFVYALGAQNNFARLLIIGFFVKIMIETVTNIGMNLGVMPVAGLPLPFLSYGGSHMVIDFMLLGMIWSIRKNSINI